MRWRLRQMAEPIQRPTRLLLPICSSRPKFPYQTVERSTGRRFRWIEIGIIWYLRREWRLWLLIHWPGVCHGDELLLMFTSNLIPPMTDPNDIKASKMLLDLWTSFSANGYYNIYFDRRIWSEFSFYNILCILFSYLEYRTVTKLLAIGFRLRNNSPVTSESTWRVPFSSTTRCHFNQDLNFGHLYCVLILMFQSKRNCNEIQLSLYCPSIHKIGLLFEWLNWLKVWRNWFKFDALLLR